MTTIDLYKQLRTGKITESKFLYEVRRDERLPFIVNTTSFKDAVQMLKNKSIISESALDDKTTAIIDRLNPYAFKVALQSELDKLPEITNELYAKTRAKVAKKMQKNPKAYENNQFSNAKDVAKADEPLQMIPVKEGNHIDEKRQMKKVKGHQKPKANTKASKKENRKGNPKGVKMMKEALVKSTIMESLLKEIFKKKVKLTEDTHPHYGMGQEVPLPEIDAKHFGVKAGTVREINGGTLGIQLEVLDEDGQPLMIHRQVNVIDHAKNEDRGFDKHDEVNDAINANGNKFKVGDTVLDEKGKEVVIKGFKKEQGKMKALISQGMYATAIDIDGLSPKKEPNAFDKLPNLGGSGQSWLSKQNKDGKLKELFNKLKEVSKSNLKESKKEKKKEVEESLDVVKGKDSTGQDQILTTTTAGSGTKVVQSLKSKGVKSATSSTIV